MRWPLLFHETPAIPSRDRFCQQCFGHFHQGDFALPAHHHIDEGLAQRFVGQQSRVPAAKDNWQPWKVALDRGGYFDRALDHRAR